MQTRKQKMDRQKINISYSSILKFAVLTTVFVCIICLLKYFVLNVILSGGTDYSNRFFSLTPILNTGAAFSILISHTKLLIFISLFVLFGISSWVVFYSSTLTKAEIIAVSMLLSGVIMNLYERATLGYVIDYIKLNFVSFPIFNFSDIAIVSGAILYIFILYSKRD